MNKVLGFMFGSWIGKIITSTIFAIMFNYMLAISAM